MLSFPARPAARPTRLPLPLLFLSLIRALWQALDAASAATVTHQQAQACGAVSLDAR